MFSLLRTEDTAAQQAVAIENLRSYAHLRCHRSEAQNRSTWESEKAASEPAQVVCLGGSLVPVPKPRILALIVEAVFPLNSCYYV